MLVSRKTLFGCFATSFLNSLLELIDPPILASKIVPHAPPVSSATKAVAHIYAFAFTMPDNSTVIFLFS